VRLPSPPITPPTNAISSGSWPIVGETAPLRKMKRMATALASRPVIAKADMITQFARTPTSCAMRKSSDEARNWMPSIVRLSRRVIAITSTITTTAVTIARRETSTPPTSNCLVSVGYGATPFGGPCPTVMKPSHCNP